MTREFVKHIIVALKEDDWIIKSRAIKHVKSFLIIDTDEMQPVDVPFKFTRWERYLVGRHVRNLRDRMLMTKFVESRITPRKQSSYGHENTFLG